MRKLVLRPADDGRRRRIVVAIDQSLLHVLPTRWLRTRSGIEVVFVAAGAEPADLVIGPYEPTRSGRELLAQTLSGALYEIDEQRRVWRNAELVHPEPLYDFGTPTTNELGVLRAGHPAALLFVHAPAHLRIRVTTPLIVVGSSTRLRRPPQDVRDWLTRASPLQES